MADRKQDIADFSRRNRWWMILAGVIALVVLLAAFMSQRRAGLQVRATKVARTTITSAIATNGKIEPLNNFEAHAPGPTTVRRLLVREGDNVKRGQLLLQLDDAEARAQAAKAQAALRAAEADLQASQRGGTHEEVLTTESQLVKARAEREAAHRNLEAMRRLQEKGAASAGEVGAAENRLRAAEAELNLLQQKQTNRYSPPELTRVQAQVAQARAAYQAAQQLVRDSNIAAPHSGAVYSLPVRTGQFVNAGDLLLQVADLSKMQVRAFVDEPDIGRLQQGQRVLLSWDAIPGRMWEGMLTHVPSTVIPRGTRTVGEITCVVDNSDRKLLPNVNVSVQVITAEHHNALAVPREAVHQEDGRRFVYGIVNGEIKKQYIETSISNLTSIEVTKGLTENAPIVLGAINSRSLREGQGVRVVE